MKRGKRRSWLGRQMRKRPLPIWLVAAIDILILGIALVIYALFHHVLPRQQAAMGIVSNRGMMAAQTVATSTPMPTSAPTAEVFLPLEKTAAPAVQTAEATVFLPSTAVPTETPAPTAEPTPEPVGYFGSKFADKFTAGEVVQEGNNYKSGNVNVTITEFREYGSKIYLADIYIKDISCLKSGFAEDTYGKGYSEWPKSIAKRMGSVVTINGDYYGTRDTGNVVRNGVFYRECKKTKLDVCVIYWDGTMKIVPAAEFDAQTEVSRGAYQVWNFGPSLLDVNGQAIEDFDSRVKAANPRSAIGYFEPGHYCFVVCDGRSSSSKGLSLRNLSKVMAEIGCASAYNLDGGKTAQMVAGSTVISKPSDGGRQCSDVITIVDAIDQN